LRLRRQLLARLPPVQERRQSGMYLLARRE